MIKRHTIIVSGYYPPSCFVFKTYNVSGAGFCLRLQVEPTQLGPIDRASPCFQANLSRFQTETISIVLNKKRTVDNVQKHNNCIYIP
jgi:hypothetical protein